MTDIEFEQPRYPITAYDQLRYPLSIAARATGWDLATLRSYFDLKKFEWRDGDVMAANSGAPGLLSIRSVIRLGIAFEFWKIGVSPAGAFNGALKFTDLSSPNSGLGVLPERRPCHLFPDPYNTYLVLKPTNPPAPSAKKGRERFYLAEVAAVKNGDQIDVEAIMYDLFNGEPGAVAIVDVNRVWNRIMTALDVKA
jgi:hypothetical protein